VGYLTNANADPKRIEDFTHALADLGHVEGRSITIEVRGATAIATTTLWRRSSWPNR
jgi:hypothetical protein